MVHEVTDTAAALQLAAAGLGATTMTPLMLRLTPRPGDLVTLRMSDPLTRRIVLLSRRDLEERQPVRVFVEEARTAVSALLASLTW